MFIVSKEIYSRRGIYLILASFSLFAMGVFFIWAGTLRIPDLASFEERRVQSSTKIYDRTGSVLLYDIHDNVKRTVVPWSDMGTYIKNATVAIEDRDFYQHGGVRLTSIARAILINIFRGGSQGGSTITQQVIKNALLTQEKKISRKLKEWVLAVRLERVMSKEDILALYLNEAPYGGSVYGVAEASRRFYGKTPLELTLAEAAYLAALPQAPTFYSPYGEHRDGLEARKSTVLTKMHELGFITKEEYEEAVAEQVVFLPYGEGSAKALHFVMYVRSYLEEKYGKEAIEEGLKVITTLDYNLQEKGEAIALRYAKENEIKFKAKNAGLIALDPKTGQILTMIGSRDYEDKEIDGNFNITLAHRQPGSSFKPIVYATALMQGYTPETVVFDVKTEFQTTCTPDGKPLPGTTADCYTPENYDSKYRGPVTFRSALAQSLNVPSVKVLYLAGLNESLSTARSLGITGLKNRDQYGLTLVLGGGEVTLLELTSAYGVFSQEGVRRPTTAILRVETEDGQVLEEWRDRSEVAIPREVAIQINDILSDNEARKPAFDASGPLFFPGREVAVKTGTTNDYRDAWVLGYTPSIAVGAWAGNNDNSPMEKKIAGFIIAPLWNAFMKEALKTVPDEKFSRTQKERDLSLKPVLRGVWWGGKSFLIDSISKKLATDKTPEDALEEMVVREPHSILYWVSKQNPLGEPPLNPESDPQFRSWEFAIQKWITETRPFIPGVLEENIPKEFDNIHTEEGQPKISITSPLPNTTLRLGERVTVSVKNDGLYPITRLDVFINDTFVASAPAPLSFFLDESMSSGGDNELRVVAYDSVLNKSEASVLVRVSF